MRRPSAPTLLSALALAVAAAALVVALRDDAPAGPRVETATRPAGLWRAVPTEDELPTGWRVQVARVGGDRADATAQLTGPERLSGFLTLTRHDEGSEGAHLLLQDFRESADALPGRKREQIGRLGSEAVAVRETYQAGGFGGGDGPHIQSIIIVWRRGDVVAQLSVQDVGTYIAPGRSEPSRPIDFGQAEALARAIDARLERELR